MIIAVDATGGEYAPHEIVKGAIKAAQEYKVEIALVGDKTMLHVLASRYSKKLDFSIVDADQIIEMHESPVRAVSNKPNSSICVGINLVRDGTASAFVSAGNSGAVVYASLLSLGKIEGVERPAIGSIITIESTPFLLIDVGANADCRPDHLVQFAHLGVTYARQVMGIISPRVGLLSNGEEDTKGNHLVKQTHRLLHKSTLNFVGNLEGQDITRDKADVIVTDGFTGNIVIKTIEGVGDSFQNLQRQLGQALTSAAHRLQGRALLQMIGMDSWTRRLDYREAGGACLLGVKGNIVIAHGRSQAKAIKNAIGLAKRAAERNLSEAIKEDILLLRS